MGTDEKSMLLDKNDPNQQGGVGVSWLLVVAVAVAIIVYVTVVTVVFLTKIVPSYVEFLHACMRNDCSFWEKKTQSVRSQLLVDVLKWLN